MSIVPFVENGAVYSQGFRQGGFGMPKYRGSPMMGGSFFGRVISFVKGLFSKAAPYVSSIVSQAQPHVKTVANNAINSLVDKAVTHVTEKLKEVGEQKGSGKRKKLKKVTVKGKRKRLRKPTTLTKISKL